MSTRETQVEITERLQLKMLERWERLLDSDELSPTDAATLARLLAQNGWNIDPAMLPKGVKGLLTKDVDPSKLDQSDDVLVFKTRAG